MSDRGFDLGTTFCQNPECDERIDKFGDDVFRLTPPAGRAPATGLDAVYCSARCVARGMVDYDGVDRVNVYDADETTTTGVTAGGITDD